MKTELNGKVVLPNDEGWDEARRAWNLTVDQRPAAVVYPESVADVQAAIELARAKGLRIAPQATGHRASPLGSLHDTMLLKSERMRAVQVDPEAQIARIGSGAIWGDVIEAAGRNELAALAGSGADVGAAGYLLGGGISWLGRKYGLAARCVEAIELVTADGQALRADRHSQPELFWALRGGGGGLGVVTALEMRLYPIREVYAGVLWWPIERDREVLHAWRELIAGDVPDELMTVGRYRRFPQVPEIPEDRRGKSFVVVQAIHLGDPAQADDLLAPLRALEPIEDTIRTIPAPELIKLHGDQPRPSPGMTDGLLLSRLTPDAVDALARATGAGTGSPLASVELRQLGGELGRPRPDDGALRGIDADVALVAVGPAPTPERKAAASERIEAIRQALAPWTSERASLNFADTSRDPRSFWPAETYDRLRRIKSQVDPDDLIRANHPLVRRSSDTSGTRA